MSPIHKWAWVFLVSFFVNFVPVLLHLQHDNIGTGVIQVYIQMLAYTVTEL